MATYLNHVTIAAPRDGTVTHTVDPNSGVSIQGTKFTPVAGRLLVCVVEGAVTSTTPSGWTLPSGGAAVSNTGHYVWYRTAAGADSLSTTHNGSGFPVVFHFIEFAAGSTFASAAAAVDVAYNNGAGPSLTGLTDAPWVAGTVGQGVAGAASPSLSWSVGTELANMSVPLSSTDGYIYGLTHLADYGSGTWAPTANTGFSAVTVERLVFSVVVAATTYSAGVTGAGAVTAKATQRAGSSASGVGAVSAGTSGAASGTASVLGAGTVTAASTTSGALTGQATVVGAGVVAGIGSSSGAEPEPEPVGSTWLLRPPTVAIRHPGTRWSIPTGVSLVVTGSRVRAAQYVDNAERDAADHVYLGGHEHIVSEAEATVLTDAGYGSYLTPNL